MTETLENESHNLPVNFPNLTSEEKQMVRENLYKFSDEPNFDKYELLKRPQILYYVDDVPNHGKKGDEYRNHFEWNVEGLNEICNSEKMDFKKVNFLLNPQEKLTYSKIEMIFDGDIDLILKTMTLLTNNYLTQIILRKEELFYDQIDSPDYIKFLPRLLFNDSEEKLFLTGLRLLQEFNINHNYQYIENLIKEIKSIIASFNQGLIIDKVKRYANRIPFNDLKQEGYKGIIQAINKFDIDKNIKFSTYAKPSVDNCIMNFYFDNYSSIYHPFDLMLSVNNFKKERDLLKFKLNREPTFEEVVKICNEKDVKLPWRLDAIKLTLQQSDLISLDKPINKNTSKTLLDSIGERKSESNSLQIKDFIEILDFLVKNGNLSDLELRVLELNSGVHLNGHKFDDRKYTYDEISTLLKISKEKIGRIKRKALDKLQKTSDMYGIKI